MKRRPVVVFAILTFGLAIAGSILLWQYSRSMNLLWAWLIVLNLITFLVFGYDKALSRSERMRVPEIVLLALTFTGGTVGALLGRIAFRHKTSKASFRARFWIAVVIQLALVALYLLYFELGVLRK